MSTRPTCRTCGDPVSTGARSNIPPDQAECRPCRRARTQPKPEPFSEQRRCLTCGHAYDARRANQKYCSIKCRGRGATSTTNRGYGHAHKVERERHRPTVDAGLAYCTELTCLMTSRWIQPGTPWDLAHNRTTGGYLGPAHRRCNRTEGMRYKQQRDRA